MTIGIAASGRWAGAGTLSGLRAVEEVARGVIGGFVSLAVLTEDQKLLRAETQAGGAQSLFDGPPSDDILQARWAGLISSGPNRPAPLSQFVAAMPRFGLVTGHRFPHARTNDGQALNHLVLSMMQAGRPPQDAVDDVIVRHPDFDAGFLALSVHGEIGLGNTPAVASLKDQGSLITRCTETGNTAATLHNAIRPHRVIALLANEVALEEMRFRATCLKTITICAGVAIVVGDTPEIVIDNNHKALRVIHPAALDAVAETAFGVGDHVKITKSGKMFGWLDQEPFMVVSQGVIVTLDGEPAMEVPIRAVSTGA
jgi:hypothetical protein